MAEIIQVRPKGVYVTIEFPLEELRLLKKGFEMVVIHANLNDEYEFKVNEYLTSNFYPLVKKVVEDLDHGS